MLDFGPFKFIRDKFSGLDGKTKVSFQCHQGELKLVADSMGVQINTSGLLLLTMDDLQGFAEVLSEAWKEHRALVPKIVTSASGH